MKHLDNNANLANCKRLYELSGWGMTDFYYPVDPERNKSIEKREQSW